MAISQGYIDYVLEQLERFGHVSARRMFGGAGIYHQGLFFALITSDDRFYLKVDDTNRPEFVARGSEAFKPPSSRPMRGSMPYMTVPEEVLEDPDELAVWARKSVAVAARSKA
jgi:DNA transformation protein